MNSGFVFQLRGVFLGGEVMNAGRVGFGCLVCGELSDCRSKMRED